MPYKNKEKARTYAREYNQRAEVKAKKKERMNKYRKKNKEKISKCGREYYQRNKKEILKKHKAYKRKNKNKLKEHSKKYYNNPKNKEKSKKYYQKNKKEICERIKKYRSNPKNKGKISLRRNKYCNKRRKEDTDFRLIVNLRRRLNHALNKYSQTGKIMTSKKYGINYKKIIEHLKPFPKDIDNYEVDHIIPLSWFNFNNPKEIKWAFSPENHQWLLKEENESKGNRFMG